MLDLCDQVGVLGDDLDRAARIITLAGLPKRHDDTQLTVLRSTSSEAGAVVTSRCRIAYQ
jgi:hypothetical protein